MEALNEDLKRQVAELTHSLEQKNDEELKVLFYVIVCLIKCRDSLLWFSTFRSNIRVSDHARVVRQAKESRRGGSRAQSQEILQLRARVDQLTTEMTEVFFLSLITYTLQSVMGLHSDFHSGCFSCNSPVIPPYKGYTTTLRLPKLVTPQWRS